MSKMFELLGGVYQDRDGRIYSAIRRRKNERGPIIKSDRDLAAVFGASQFREIVGKTQVEAAEEEVAKIESVEPKSEPVVADADTDGDPVDALALEVKEEKKKPTLKAKHTGRGNWDVYKMGEDGKYLEKVNSRTLTKKQALARVEKGE